MKKTKHYFSCVVIVFAVLCWFSMDTPAAYGAYEALETNYQSKYNPDNYPATGNYQLVNMEVHNPGKSTFRVYIPQGATRADLRFYMGQDVKIGAAVRMGLHPECVYNINMDGYYDLPWGRYDGTSVAALYGKDFQARNQGGQIVILSTAKVSTGGEWIYVKVLKYDSSDIGIVYLAVWVDAAQYKTWYDDYTGWDAQNNPSQTLSGSTGGYCNPVWAKGGAEGGGGDDTGGGYPPFPPFPPLPPEPDPEEPKHCYAITVENIDFSLCFSEGAFIFPDQVGIATLEYADNQKIEYNYITTADYVVIEGLEFIPFKNKLILLPKDTWVFNAIE